MLVCSVMCFACLMACATSSFMSVHFPAKKVSVFVYLSVCVFVMGRYLHKYWTVNSTPPTYLSSQTVQRAYRFFWEASDLFVLEKKNVLFVTLGHIFFLYLSFLSFFYTQNSLPDKRITPLLSLLAFTGLCISVAVNISDIAPDTDHTSTSIPPYCSSFPPRPILFAAGPKINKPEKEAKHVPVRCFKINTMW